MEVPSYVIQAPDEEEDAETGEFHPLVIAETKKSMRTLSVSEAVMDLDLTRSARCRIPSRRIRTGQHGLSPKRWKYRLDRPTGHHAG